MNEELADKIMAWWLIGLAIMFVILMCWEAYKAISNFQRTEIIETFGMALLVTVIPIVVGCIAVYVFRNAIQWVDR